MSVSSHPGRLHIIIKDILVKCSSASILKAELSGLLLTVMVSEIRTLELTQTSATTWKVLGSAHYHIPASNSIDVILSDALGDLGYIHINAQNWLERQPGIVSYFQQRLDRGGEPPQLELSFVAYVSTLDKTRLFPEVTYRSDMQLTGSPFPQAQNEGSIWATIASHEQLILFLSPESERFGATIISIAAAYHQCYKIYGKAEDLDEAIAKWNVAVAVISDMNPDWLCCLNSLADALSERFDRCQMLGDICDAIRLWRLVHHLTRERDPNYNLPCFLNNLGNALLRRSERLSGLGDISEAIEFLERAVRLSPEGIYLGNLGNAFGKRFKINQKLEDISAAIAHHKRAVRLFPDKHPIMPHILSYLAKSLTIRYQSVGNPEDISEAIKAQERAISALPVGDQQLYRCLDGLGFCLSVHFEQTGEASSLIRAIDATKQGLELLPLGHANRPQFLNRLGGLLLDRLSLKGEQKDLLEAIQFQQLSINGMPDGHPSLPSFLDSLANSFRAKFHQMGELSDLAEAMSFAQRAVHLSPSSPLFLSNLGYAFADRFSRIGDLPDISEAIQLHRRAVQLTLEGDVQLPQRLHGLGRSLSTRFRWVGDGDVADISEAIDVGRRATELQPDGPCAATCLDGLAFSFSMSYRKLKRLPDISEAIKLLRRVVELTPQGNPKLPGRLYNLGISLLLRVDVSNELPDISEAIRLQELAISLTPDGHILLHRVLESLGHAYLNHFQHTKEEGSLSSAMSNLHLCSTTRTGDFYIAYAAAVQWAQIAKRLDRTSEIIDAYDRILHLFSLINGLDNTIERRLRLLGEAREVSSEAAAVALSISKFCKAIEWLEQGRCIIWGHINDLRTPLKDLQLRYPELARRLKDVSSRLEWAGSRIDPRLQGVELLSDAKVSLEADARHHIRLAMEREEVLTAIKSLPGFNGFLQPLSYADLSDDLPDEGPIVIINGHENRCDALVLLAASDQPIHVPLDGFSHKKAVALTQKLRQFLSKQGLSRSGEESPHDSKTRYVKPFKRPAAPQEEPLQSILAILWNDLVKPILQAVAISTEKSKDDEGSCLPRIWWCPTGPFTLLPIHAAGVYNQGDAAPEFCLADCAVSSYIPTLGILKKLGSRQNSTSTKERVLLISQPNTPKMQPIPFTTKEVRKIQRMLTEHDIGSDLYEGKEATLSSVSQCMEAYTCVHLACHASQDLVNPFESAIHLHDGPLRLSEITKKDLPYAELAFLSACQTSAGDQNLPDEVVHLSAAMLTAGYRSVVGTMWSIYDTYAPEVAEVFYQNLLTPGSVDGCTTLDTRQSARALHCATGHLRKGRGNSTQDGFHTFTSAFDISSSNVQSVC